MSSSFEAFLTDRKLGELSLGDSKSSILSKMGTPGWWEGQGTLGCEHSDVWAYDDLGVVFESNHVVKLEVAFTGTGTANEPLLPCDFKFVDVDVSSKTTIDQFIKYLSLRSIPFNQQPGRFGTTLIKVPNGAVAAFRHRVDHERSVAEESESCPTRNNWLALALSNSDSRCYGPNCDRTFDRINRVRILGLIWRLDPRLAQDLGYRLLTRPRRPGGAQVSRPLRLTRDRVVAGFWVRGARAAVLGGR